MSVDARSEAGEDTVVVETPLGSVRGRTEGRCAMFRRLRYARPPIAGLRFRKPQPVSGWSDVLDCTAPGPIPPQMPGRLSRMVMGEYVRPQDEDCLHVDIYTPVESRPGRPVLVFVHGGAFMVGGGSQPCYEGSVIASVHDMVVVSVSYRLGILGFLPIDGVAPANLGVHDQIAALRFIQAMIGSFGGDPENITVAGQSAGAYLAALLVTNSSCRGLFRRAVLMSAPLGMALQTEEACKPAASALLAALGLSAGNRAALASMPVERLLEGQLAVLRSAPPSRGDVTPPFAPVLDDEIVTADPLEMIRAGNSAWCDIVFGTTREEMAAFYIGDDALEDAAGTILIETLTDRYGKDAQSRLARARACRVPSSALALLADHYTDLRFETPNVEAATAHARAGGRCFSYRFDWQSPLPRAGACHCLDLPFLFGNLAQWSTAPMLVGADRHEMEDLSRLFQGGLAAFARSGDPRGAGLADWPDFAPDRSFISFDRRIEACRFPTA